jgi:hypothetical protein
MKILDLMKQADMEVREVHRRLSVEDMGGVNTISAENTVVFALVAIALMAESQKMLKLKQDISIKKFEDAVGRLCVEIGFDDTAGVDAFFGGPRVQ